MNKRKDKRRCEKISLKAIEEKLKERIEIENAIKEIQSQISEEETIEKIIQVLETKDKIIDFMLDDLNLNGYKKEEIYNSYKSRAISYIQGR